MKICILGNSQVFVKIIKEMHPRAEIEIAGWRSLSNRCSYFDIVYICGFDKGIYSQSFKNFLYNGYFKQYLFIKHIKKINEEVKIVYIGTKTNSKIIVSRYDFAKNRLAYKLALLGGFYNVQLDFIVDEKGLPISSYGSAYLLGFLFLRKFNILQICKISSIKIKIQSAKFISASPMHFRTMFLIIPRPMILDKFMKFIFLFIS